MEAAAPTAERAQLQLSPQAEEDRAARGGAAEEQGGGRPVLTYFNFKGSAEAIRLALFIGGVDFEDRPDEADLNTKCRSRLADGSRCTGRGIGYAPRARGREDGTARTRSTT